MSKKNYLYFMFIILIIDSSGSEDLKAQSVSENIKNFERLIQEHENSIPVSSQGKKNLKKNDVKKIPFNEWFKPNANMNLLTNKLIYDHGLAGEDAKRILEAYAGLYGASEPSCRRLFPGIKVFYLQGKPAFFRENYFSNKIELIMLHEFCSADGHKTSNDQVLHSFSFLPSSGEITGCYTDAHLARGHIEWKPYAGNKQIYTFTMKIDEENPIEGIMALAYSQLQNKGEIIVRGGKTTPPRIYASYEGNEVLVADPLFNIPEPVIVPGLQEILNITLKAKNPEGIEEQIAVNVPVVVYKPLNIATYKPVKTIVFLHGGPREYTDHTFDYLSQYLINQGYVFLGINYPGSTGFGTHYECDIDGKYGPTVAADAVAQTLVQMKTRKIINSQNISLLGHSHGGWMTSYLMTHPEHKNLFVSGIAISGIQDWSKRYAKEWQNKNMETWGFLGKKSPVKDEGYNRLISPIFHTENLRSPLFLIHGTEDDNVHVGHSDDLYKAIKSNESIMHLGHYMRIEGAGHNLETPSIDQFSILQAFEKVSIFLESSGKNAGIPGLGPLTH